MSKPHEEIASGILAQAIERVHSGPDTRIKLHPFGTELTELQRAEIWVRAFEKQCEELNDQLEIMTKYRDEWKRRFEVLHGRF